MITKLVGLKEFRQNLSSYAKEVEGKQIRIIVLNKNKPVMEVNPIDAKEVTLNNLKKDIQKARREAKHGKVDSIKEVRKNLGL